MPQYRSQGSDIAAEPHLFSPAVINMSLKGKKQPRISRKRPVLEHMRLIYEPRTQQGGHHEKSVKSV
jgi:hypothetical protein